MFLFPADVFNISSTEPGGARREKGCSQTYDVEFKVEELFTSYLKFYIPNNLREIIFIPIYAII